MSKFPPNHHIPKNLELSDQILAEAAKQFGTPLYVYDAAMMEKNLNYLRSIIPDNVAIFYSVKANPNHSIINIFKELGTSFEVASSGELAAVLHAGCSPNDVIFVGPGKSKPELEKAIVHNIKAIVVESQREIEDIQILSDFYGKKTPVALRINPGRGKGTIVMGGQTQFGMEMEITLSILTHTKNYPNLEIIGIHAYLGTGILAWETVLEHSQLILQVADNIQRESHKELSFIDIGGGFGIPYYEPDKEPDWKALHVPLSQLIDRYLHKHPHTKMVAIESGRFLVGSSGVFVTSILDIKTSGGKCFAILDGGTNVFGGDNRYRGFRSTPVRVLSDQSSDNQPITLCGPLCTSADQLAVDTLLPKPKIGDLVAFYQAGAYGLTASPGFFLSHGFPCEVLFYKEQLSLIQKRITPDYFLSSTFPIRASGKKS